ncbi:CRISPR-associated endonuclease Cas2 [Peptacetobacter hiranonis]|uniref:CRISPR-associated endonuclease Cas2 n=1 Tax=Peptacetobacter hiranonis TaxID=89152 RepID=UPI0022E39DB9|nr:CRISPR-associated endonuclease Cas2 [Peptacetobacter hiranonis]
MYIILVYDIKLDDGGSRILRKVFNTCKKYLSHIQNSVFEGELSKAQLIALKSELKKYVRDDKDSVIIFESKNSKWLDKEMLGLKVDKTDQFL